MTAALICLAAAFVAAPAHPARARFRTSAQPGAPATGPDTRVRRWAARHGPVPHDLGFLVCIPLAVTGAIGPAVAAAIVVATLRRRYRRRSAAAARDRACDGVLAGLDIVIGELRVGAHPAVACATAADECAGTGKGTGAAVGGTDAAVAAFRGAAARARLGGSAAAGFAVPDSVVADDLRRIATAWTVAEDRGLALADLLHAARTDLQGRKRFRSRTEASLSGARATAAVLAGLPLLGVGLGQMMGAAPIRVLLGGGLGAVLLVVGTALVASGLVWTDRIVDGVVR
ncbi:type II secretion system F family protein [Prescottella subtropica]|uniref:type II secretion system F family protein n=1 Tax=Prescottella subtropica TaxID=2545757 RepID=UPI0010F4EADE|nr:type II secretion system F family protein [Prescottella subtropica]